MIKGKVRQVLDALFTAAGISSGRIFRRVNRVGRVWGEVLTEKAVWHVVKELAGKTRELPNLPRTT